jgi:glycosyltransferase involved in cell wall biosynthesis
MSLVLLEAMAAGACIVATDVDGAREALGSEAALVAPEEVRGLAAAIVGRLEDPSGRAEAGARARSTVERNHHVRMTRQRVRDLYERLAG